MPQILRPPGGKPPAAGASRQAEPDVPDLWRAQAASPQTAQRAQPQPDPWRWAPDPWRSQAGAASSPTQAPPARAAVAAAGSLSLRAPDGHGATALADPPAAEPAWEGGPGGAQPSRQRPGAQARRAPRSAHLPYFLVLAAGVAALAWVWRGGAQGTRGGTLAMGGAFAVAALARLVLPEGRAGMLASRGRLTDVVTLAALALGLLAAGLVLPTPS